MIVILIAASNEAKHWQHTSALRPQIPSKYWVLAC